MAEYPQLGKKALFKPFLAKWIYSTLVISGLTEKGGMR